MTESSGQRLARLIRWRLREAGWRSWHGGVRPGVSVFAVTARTVAVHIRGLLEVDAERVRALVGEDPDLAVDPVHESFTTSGEPVRWFLVHDES